MNNLLKKKCIPCEAGVGPLTEVEARNYMPDVPDWEINADSTEIFKEYKFKDFIGAVNFINKIAEIAESEGHHPDISIHYNRVRLTNSTHAIKGLSENDFILAAKIDASQ
jgi:4a-hydroxytetrahydrobiopterin dehydratase